MSTSAHTDCRVLSVSEATGFNLRARRMREALDSPGPKLERQMAWAFHEYGTLDILHQHGVRYFVVTADARRIDVPFELPNANHDEFAIFAAVCARIAGADHSRCLPMTPAVLEELAERARDVLHDKTHRDLSPEVRFGPSLAWAELADGLGLGFGVELYEATMHRHGEQCFIEFGRGLPNLRLPSDILTDRGDWQVRQWLEAGRDQPLTFDTVDYARQMARMSVAQYGERVASLTAKRNSKQSGIEKFFEREAQCWELADTLCQTLADSRGRSAQLLPGDYSALDAMAHEVSGAMRELSRFDRRIEAVRVEQLDAQLSATKALLAEREADVRQIESLLETLEL